MKRQGSGAILLGLALGSAAAVYALALRPRHLRWGATDAELAAPLPGDELTPNANSTSTHAITIEAPPADVWPWLVQVGQDKGGFYSYAWLENLLGCQMHNADRILPEFQHLAPGDEVRLHPKAPPLPVLIVEPERALVMGSNTSEPGTWGFYLEPLGSNRTRLITRGRGEVKPGLLRRSVQYGIFEPAHFLMERKMLLRVKDLAESLARGRRGALEEAGAVTEVIKPERAAA